jgi:transposase
METDVTRICELMLNLPDMSIVGFDDSDPAVARLHVESRTKRSHCRRCGMQATVKDRPVLEIGDLPICGRPSILLWRKYRWTCPGACGGSWTEQRDDIVAVNCSALTVRAGHWATRQVGAAIRPVSHLAAELGVSWHTVMDTVTFWAQPLINDPARVGATTAVGVDETCFESATASHATTWLGSVVDVDKRFVIDVFDGRQSADLTAWLATRDRAWRDGVATVVTDLHEPFRAAITNTVTGFVNACLVADPFHVVGVGNRVVDRVRRRVQNEQHGHRGRRTDPLYRTRKLLLIAGEKIPAGSKPRARLDAYLAIGDPDGEVREALALKELVRDIYTLWNDEPTARMWVNAIIDEARISKTKEIKGLGRTLRQWIEPIVAWHSTGASNGPTEGLNSVIKKIKRTAAGFKNRANYRVRILLACGNCNWDLLGT